MHSFELFSMNLKLISSPLLIRNSSSPPQQWSTGLPRIAVHLSALFFVVEVLSGG